MHHHRMHHARELRFLLLFLLIFCIIFFVAFLDLLHNVAMMGVLPARIEDPVIMFFSVLAVIKVIWHLATW
jgi:hypothetical protein